MSDRTAERGSGLIGRAHLSHLLILLGAFLGAVAWWLPWVTHENGAAALVLLGLDLGDFPKYTEVWRPPVLGGRGLLRTERLFFFLPPLVASIILVLEAAGQRSKGYLLLLPLTLFLSVVILPAIDLHVLPVLQGKNPASEFAFQLYTALAGVTVNLLWPFWRRVAPAARYALILLVALAGTVLPAWALWRYWLILSDLYGGGNVVGTGVILSSSGFALVLLVSLGHLVRRRSLKLEDRTQIQSRVPSHPAQSR